MTTPIRLFQLFVIAILLFSCNEPGNAEAENANEPIESPSGIVLVDNKKWKVDPNMMVHLRNLEKVLNDTNQKNLDTVGADLEHHLDLLTSNCTMKGQAHDELHKWLVPFINDVSQFNEESDEKKRKKQALKLKDSFAEFNSHFE